MARIGLGAILWDENGRKILMGHHTHINTHIFSHSHSSIYTRKHTYVRGAQRPLALLSVSFHIFTSPSTSPSFVVSLFFLTPLLFFRPSFYLSLTILRVSIHIQSTQLIFTSKLFFVSQKYGFYPQCNK